MMGDVQTQPFIKQNLDTNFLKFIAIICMAIDHVGKVFFPDNMALAIIGRIAFPLFAYCLVVGCLYTHHIKKYLIRLSIFAVISQPFFNMAFHPTWQQFWEEFFSVNIFFTLIAGVIAVYALMNIKKRWWILLVPIAMELFIGLDYGFYGIALMSIFYLCRNNSRRSLFLIVAWICLNGLRGDFITVCGFGIGLQVFSLLALPFIYLHTNRKPAIHKYFFYVFYPVHLFILFLLRLALHV